MTFCLSPQIKVNLDCLNIFGCVVFHSIVVDLQEAAFFPSSYQLVFKWMNTNITEKKQNILHYNIIFMGVDIHKCMYVFIECSVSLSTLESNYGTPL